MKNVEWACLLGRPEYDGYRALCGQMAESGLPATFLESEDWTVITDRVRQGRVPVVALCGLLYKALRAAGCPLQAVAAPILDQPRYSRPLYWSEVLVRADSDYQDVQHLRGKTWLFNETDSCSGYRCFVAELAKLGMDASFLGESVATGSHAASLQRLAAGEGDYSVIDSTVFDYLPAEEKARFRVLHSVGPMPTPLVACLPGYEQHARALLSLKELPHPFAGFVEVTDADYDVLEADWNLTVDLLGGAAPYILGDEGLPERGFTSLAQARTDQAVLADTLQEVLAILGTEPSKEIPGGKFYLRTVDGLERHTYVMQPDKLSGENMAIVGFFSRMKPDVDLPALFEADAKITALFHQYPGMLIYAPKEYAPGMWGNLVIFENREAQREWVTNAPHLEAIRDLTEASYDNIRLHVGVWRNRGQPLEWVATKYLHCTPQGMWRGVRTYSPGE